MSEVRKTMAMIGLTTPQMAKRLAEAERIRQYMITDNFTDAEVARVDKLALTTRAGWLESYYRVRAERDLTAEQIDMFEKLNASTGISFNSFLVAIGGGGPGRFPNA